MMRLNKKTMWVRKVIVRRMSWELRFLKTFWRKIWLMIEIGTGVMIIIIYMLIMIIINGGYKARLVIDLVIVRPGPLGTLVKTERNLGGRLAIVEVSCWIRIDMMGESIQRSKMTRHIRKGVAQRFLEEKKSPSQVILAKEELLCLNLKTLREIKPLF